MATTAHAERVQNEFASQRNEINQLQAQLAALDLNQLLHTQGLVTDETMRSAMIGMSGGEKKDERSPWQKPILESEAITDLAPITCSKTYRD